MALREPARPMGKQDAIEVLHQDHSQVDQLLARALASKDDGELADLFERVARAIEVHAETEEQVLYPAIADRMPGGTELEAAAVAEHKAVTELLLRLRMMGSSDERFRDVLAALAEDVRAHVLEEESTLLPGLADTIGEDGMIELGQQLLAMKEELGP